MLIKHKLIASSLAVALLIGLLGGLSFYHSIGEAERIARHEAESVAKTVAIDIAGHLSGKTPSVFADLERMEEDVRKLKEVHGRDIVVVDMDQRIIADAVPSEVGSIFNHDRNDEVGRTLRDGKSRTFTEVSDAYPEGIKLLAIPLDSDEGVRLGALVLEYTPLYRQILAIVGEDAEHFLCYYLAAVGIALSIGYLIARKISLPLKEMQNAALRIAGGDLEARVQYSGRDELGFMADGFNRMAGDVQNARDELIRANERLHADIARRKEAEKALVESEKRLRTLVDAIPDQVFFKDAEGRHLLFNKAGEEAMGIPMEELLGTTVEDLLPPEIAKICRLNDEKVMDGLKPVHSDEIMHDKDGNELILDVTKVPLYGGSGNSIGLVGVARNVTEQKLAEKALKESEEKLRHLFESANDAILVLDLEGNLIEANRTAHERLGYTKEEFLSMNISRLDTPEFAAMIPERIEHLKKHGKGVFESAHMRKDGTAMPVEINSRALKLAGEKVLFSVVRDITERKRAEESMKASLKEKEILLQEIHHRVKNNMAVITSLLMLQSRNIKNEEVRRMFMESQNRIKSMALIHEKLYMEGDLLRINFRKYVESLVGDLFSSYKVKAGNVKRTISIEDIALDIDTMIPCGLIINELVTNSLKHAYKNTGSPELTIGLTADGDNRLVLLVGDNGCGIAEDFSIQNSGSLGLQIVDGLVKQLRGDIVIDRSGGTAFRISFAAPGKARG
jgi:PAS domain S-box-containing protein